MFALITEKGRNMNAWYPKLEKWNTHIIRVTDLLTAQGRLKI